MTDRFAEPSVNIDSPPWFSGVIFPIDRVFWPLVAAYYGIEVRGRTGARTKDELTKE